MQIHKFNRENEGEKIIQRRKKKEEEKNRKNKTTVNSINSSKSKPLTFINKINKGMLLNEIPIYKEIEPNGENNSLMQFHTDILQFIIKNNVFKDEDFNILIEELVKKNFENRNVTRSVIERIVLEIKNDLET